MNRAVFGVYTAAAVLLLLVAPTVFGQDELGTGMNDTAPRLLGAVRSAAPSGAYVEQAGRGGGIPRRVDLSDRMPTPGHQGPIGSCGAWATAYALRSYQENVERGWGADSEEEVFSPSFLYNLFSDGEDRGSHFPGLFALLEKQGCATLATMPYTTDLSVEPGPRAIEEARSFRIASYERLDPESTDAVKSVLADGQPVVYGATLYRDFVSYDGGVYRRRSPEVYGAHGMTLVGYDDGRGAFKLINSWGTSWGEGGYAWVDYDTFRQTTFEAYRVEDVVERPDPEARAPVSVRASQGSSTEMVRISWKPVGAPAYFVVYRADNRDGKFGRIGSSRNPGYRDEEALPGVDYMYAVRSILVTDEGAELESPLSSVAIGRRAEPDPSTRIPGVPGDLTALADGTTVRVSWSAVDGAAGYRVYRFDDARGDFLSIGETADTGFLDRSIAELGADTESASYVVSAFNDVGEGDATEVAIVAIDLPDPPLPAPAWIGVDDRAGPGRQRLRWTPVEGAGSYRVERYDEAADTWRQVTTVRDAQWTRREWAQRRTYRVVPLDGTRPGNPSTAVVMGNLPVDEDEFGDFAYRDDEWERRRRELGFSEGDDRAVPAGARQRYRGEWEERDLFDFDEIQSFFEEALRAEEEAFRKYRREEQDAFEEFLESERGG